MRKLMQIMHDCRNDSVNLYREFGIRLRNVFDTQAAHVVIQQQQKNDQQQLLDDAKKIKNISLNNLCSLYCNNTVFNPFKEKIKVINLSINS
jgi:exonuclease 3'-5' domain-containing protein 1